MGVRDTSARHPTHHRWAGRRRRVCLALITVAALIAGSAPLPVAWQRAWATEWYPVVQSRLSVVSGALPIAALDLVLLMAVGVLVLLAWSIRRGRLDRWTALSYVGLIAAVGWLAFQGLWGWHYQAPTLEQRLMPRPAGEGGAAGDSPHLSAERASIVATRAVEQINALYDVAHAQPWPAGDDERYPIEHVLNEVLVDLNAPGEPFLPLPKVSVVDRYFRWAGIDGMTNPFGLEVILNSRLLPFERPTVLAHEWAHMAGFADESDASFVAWMAGVRAGGQQAYAAWLGVLPHLLGALPAAERRAQIDALGEGPMADLRAIAARGAERWPALQEVAWRIYDRFLKANRVSEGVARYDAVTRLMLGVADERTGRLRDVSRSSPVLVP